MKNNDTFNLVMRYAGLALAMFIIVYHVLYQTIDLYLLVVPALMMGLKKEDLKR